MADPRQDAGDAPFTAGEPRTFEKDLFGQPPAPLAEVDEDLGVQGSGACAEDVEEECDPRQEALLDEGVEETFPASDPVSVKHIT
jgi:hypothetical protein